MGTEGLDTMDRMSQISVTTCAPRPLYNRLEPSQARLQATKPNSCGGEDIILAGYENMRAIIDTHLESSGETGWTVRDNPIASDSSCMPDADSDHDDDDLVQNFINEAASHMNHDMSSTTTSVEHILDLNMETEEDNYRYGLGRGMDLELTLTSKVTSPSSSLRKAFFINDERVIKPHESGNAECAKGTVEGFPGSCSCNPPQEALRSLIVEENCPYTGTEHEVKQPSEVLEVFQEVEVQHEVFPQPAPVLLNVRVQVGGRVVEVISESWRRIQSFSDLFLGGRGSLVMALAFPFALITILKLVETSSPEDFICVPT